MITIGGSEMEFTRITGQVDANGEIHEGAQLALIFPKRNNGFKEGWMALAQSPLMVLAQSNISGETFRVLMAILSQLDFENWIQLRQAETAEKIGMKRSNFSRALRELEALEVLIKGPKVGRSVTYRLNPNFGWKGSAKNHKEALKERMKKSGITDVIEGGKQKT